ncbi:hypothetical protein [Longitalea luteola]|uniref:hypothetical protein n=1 Tax=Longitalea luteola TaxID=2812563 RepID=UPI001A97858F|nr:hypothetical protein [Longitalea luteola]
MNKWKQVIMDNMFLRNACSDLSGRYFFARERGNFKPYIQFKLGRQQNDCFLYFSKVPFSREYEQAFVKAVSKNDVTKVSTFLHFHYKAYPDKQEFLNWVKLTLIASLNNAKRSINRCAIIKGIIWAQQQNDVIQFEQALKVEIVKLLEPAYDEVEILETEAFQIAEQISSGVQRRLVVSVAKF